jgi:hypothetical protein
MGVTVGSIENIYRGLFVHSIGFFQIIREATKTVIKGKECI